jgi:hypothetical protein
MRGQIVDVRITFEGRERQQSPERAGTSKNDKQDPRCDVDVQFPLIRITVL